MNSEMSVGESVLGNTRRPLDATPPEQPVSISGRKDERVRLYVWQIPVRVTHWLTFGSIMVLSVTGGYIADPFIIPPGGSVMTVMRFIHMIAAFAFLGSGLVRLYWFFAGNRFARWTAFVPIAGAQRRDLGRQILWYLFVRREAPGSLGHNPLAAGTYLVIYVLFAVQTATGFALAGAHGTEPWATLFGWLPAILGLQGVRLIHHLIMWVTLAFMIHHVYSALLVDHLERNGLLSSIFSGFKFVTRREIDEARDGGAEIQESAE
jgi:Ni/Fe-hydrogenase 1 B-type cytochrome subunit